MYNTIDELREAVTATLTNVFEGFNVYHNVYISGKKTRLKLSTGEIVYIIMSINHKGNYISFTLKSESIVSNNFEYKKPVNNLVSK